MRVPLIVKRFGLATTAFVCFLLVWQAVIALFQLHPITLPPPLTVLHTAWQQFPVLVEGFLVTGAAAILGLLSSIVTGSLLGILFSQSKLLRSALYPYVVFLQTVPIVAIAPLLITWSGYKFRTVVLIATIISLFPIVSNVTTGLISVDQNLKDLFRMSGATRWQVLVKLRIPFAVSHLVLGMRISAGLAVIGAIIGEFFVGNGASGYSGLGTVITGWQNLAKTDAVIAAIFISTLLGLSVLGLVNGIASIFLARWTRGTGFENEA